MPSIDTVGRASSVSPASRPSIWIGVFVIALIQAGYLYIGGVNLGGGRLIVLLAAIPVAVAYLSGKAGKLITADIFIILFGLWQLVSIWANHGTNASWPLTIATLAETVVPYFMARVLIRDVEAFKQLFRWIFRTVLFLLPFAAIESLTARNLLAETYSKLPSVVGFPGTGNPPRMGLFRADAAFEHPILYGLYVAIPLTVVWMVLFAGRSFFIRAVAASLCLLAVVFSVSMGAFLGVLIQGALVFWGRIMRTLRARWKLLLAGFLALYAAVAAVAESSPLAAIAMRVNLNASSAWNRVEIWNWGSKNVVDNPIFGLGYHEWERPEWMLPSVDNFWLLMAMRYGFIGFAALAIAVVSLYLALVRKNLDAYPELMCVREAHAITLLAIFLVICTVHIWSATYILFMFLLGATSWMITLPDKRAEPELADAAPATSENWQFNRADREVRYRRSDTLKHRKKPTD